MPSSAGDWDRRRLLQGKRFGELKGGSSWRSCRSPRGALSTALPGDPPGENAAFLHVELWAVLQFMSLSSYPITFHILSNFMEFSKNVPGHLAVMWLVCGWRGRGHAPTGGGEGSFCSHPVSSQCWWPEPADSCPKLLCKVESASQRQRGHSHPPTLRARAEATLF